MMYCKSLKLAHLQARTNSRFSRQDWVVLRDHAGNLRAEPLARNIEVPLPNDRFLAIYRAPSIQPNQEEE